MAANTLSKKPRKRQAKKVAFAVRLVATNRDYAEFCRESLKRVPPLKRRRLNLLTFDRWNDVALEEEKAGSQVETVFISRLCDIPESVQRQAQAGLASRHLLFLEGLPVEGIASRLVHLGVRDPRRLHIARETTPPAISRLVHRMVAGMAHAGGPKRIADAWIEDGLLVLLSPSFERMPVPLEKIARYVGGDAEARKDFEIDEDGSFLYWPGVDVHLGWEQCLYLVDPAAALAAKNRTAKFNKRYGAAIRSFRKERGLTQGEIQGMTERHLRRVEKGEVLASKTILEALASSHELPLDEYMKEIAGCAKL